MEEDAATFPRCGLPALRIAYGRIEPTLKLIAQELVKAVRNNLTIDWTVRENVRANLRVIIKRILRKFGYLPDKQEKATATVLEQAEVLSHLWAASNL